MITQVKHSKEITKKIVDCVVDYIQENELENNLNVPLTGLFISLITFSDMCGFEREHAKTAFCKTADIYFDRK